MVTRSTKTHVRAKRCIYDIELTLTLYGHTAPCPVGLAHPDRTTPGPLIAGVTGVAGLTQVGGGVVVQLGILRRYWLTALLGCIGDSIRL